MIKLKLFAHDSHYYLNPENVIGIYAFSSDCTIIEVSGGKDTKVYESPEEVARLITEYKQRQMRLQAAYTALYKDTMGSYLEEEIIAQLESEDRGE